MFFFFVLFFFAIVGPLIDAGGYSPKIIEDGVCPSQSVREDIMVDVLQLLFSRYGARPLGLIRAYPAESCDQLALASPGSRPGMYWIGSDSQDASLVTCEF